MSATVRGWTQRSCPARTSSGMPLSGGAVHRPARMSLARVAAPMTEGLDPLARTATATPEQGAPPPEAPAPESIARFRIERQLGAGAMGVVYAAFDPDLERHVAVKVLRAAPGAVARSRLLREARAMARLSHPNVVTVHEVGTSGERDYVATELIIGSNLSEWLRAAPRSKREIVDAFLAAGRGLVAAHEAGL